MCIFLISNVNRKYVQQQDGFGKMIGICQMLKLYDYYKYQNYVFDRDSMRSYDKTPFPKMENAHSIRL